MGGWAGLRTLVDSEGQEKQGIRHVASQENSIFIYNLSRCPVKTTTLATTNQSHVHPTPPYRDT